MTRAVSVTLNIDNMLKNMSFPPSKPSMFRVDDDLRSIHPKDYDPKLIAIGPFHLGNSKLKDMEEHKKWYLNLLLERRVESSVESYVTTIGRLADEARKCYPEDIQLDQEEFVQMLILDGCFIIEFLHRLKGKLCPREDDTIFNREHTQTQLLHDLMLFENQIPFLIIESLFQMIKVEDIDINSLISPLLACGVFAVDLQNLSPVPRNNAHHLLGVVHEIQCSFCLDMDSGNSGEMLNIRSAVNLEEAEISFECSEVSRSVFDIKFFNNALIIPGWDVTDSNESLIRNLIAYEHYLPGRPKKYVTDYVFFMYCLLHSSEDEKLLQAIIRNHMTDRQEMVYHVINRLVKNIIISDDFSYSNIFNKVNAHYCASSGTINRRRWMAIIGRKYFSDPWTFYKIFLIGLAIFILTVIQTMFAILSYGNDLKKGS